MRTISSRNRPFWPVLAAALIGLPVLYVASFGPAIWLVDTVNHPGLNFAIRKFYHPLFWLITDGPEPVGDAIVWYVSVFGE